MNADTSVSSRSTSRESTGKQPDASESSGGKQSDDNRQTVQDAAAVRRAEALRANLRRRKKPSADQSGAD